MQVKTKESLARLRNSLKKLIPILRSSEVESVFKLLKDKIKTEPITDIFLFLTSVFSLISSLLLIVLFIVTFIIIGG